MDIDMKKCEEEDWVIFVCSKKLTVYFDIFFESTKSDDVGDAQKTDVFFGDSFYV